MPMKLHLLSTPIGNLEDITKRGSRILEDSDCLICEDTRETKKLLDLLEISLESKHFISFHEHNQGETKKLVEKVKMYSLPVIVSDAGSPLLSDPGYPFVREWIDSGGEVTSIPGVSSVTTALELSGLPPVPFQFHGFLGKKKEAKLKFFNGSKGGVTHILFDSPHRIKNTVDELFAALPNAQVVIARELTKKFEEVLRFNKTIWETEIKEKLKEKGEFVLIFHCSEEGPSSFSNGKVKDLTQEYLKKPSSKKLAKLIAEITGDDISIVYDSLKR